MLTDDVKQEIQKAYSSFLESKGWEPRLGQKQMIAEIARTVGGIELSDAGDRVPSENENHICAYYILLLCLTHVFFFYSQLHM